MSHWSAAAATTATNTTVPVGLDMAHSSRRADGRCDSLPTWRRAGHGASRPYDATSPAMATTPGGLPQSSLVLRRRARVLQSSGAPLPAPAGCRARVGGAATDRFVT